MNVEQILLIAVVVVLSLCLIHLLFSSSIGFLHLLYESSRNSLSLRLLRKKIDVEKLTILEKRHEKKTSWAGFRKFKVDKLVKETSDITSVYLRPHDNKKLPSFFPGQYLTFNFDIAGLDKELVRCYSLSDSFQEDYYRISVKKVPPPRDHPEYASGISSTYINERMKEGEIIDVKAPSGGFHISFRDHFPVCLIGGGIGVTPVFSMLKSIATTQPERKVWFFYGVRNENELVFLEEIKEILKTSANVKIVFCLSDKPAENKIDGIIYENERIGLDLFKKYLGTNNYHFYICGPPPMMNGTVDVLEEWNVPTKSIHFEAFGPASVKKMSKGDHTSKNIENTNDVKCKVSFSKSSKVLDWDNSSETILDFAEANGIELDSGCRSGNCGVCAVAIKNGKCETIKDPVADVDEGNILTCISTPIEDIEIDA